MQEVSNICGSLVADAVGQGYQYFHLLRTHPNTCTCHRQEVTENRGSENRDFAQGDLGGWKTGYFLLTLKSWTPRWMARPGRSVKWSFFRLGEILLLQNNKSAAIQYIMTI